MYAIVRARHTHNLSRHCCDASGAALAVMVSYRSVTALHPAQVIAAGAVGGLLSGHLRVHFFVGGLAGPKAAPAPARAPAVEGGSSGVSPSA